MQRKPHQPRGTQGSERERGCQTRLFPKTTLQTCIVHLLRQSLDFANWKQRKPLAAALRAIYGAASADLALAALDTFERAEWGQRFPRSSPLGGVRGRALSPCSRFRRRFVG